MLTIPADPARPYLRLPCLLLATAMAAAILVAAGTWLARPPGTLAQVLPGCTTTALLAAAMLAYIRLVYARQTRLVLDNTGLELHQPLQTWRLNWEDVSGLFVTSPWDPAHKGGLAAGVRLSLTSGGTRHIPDVFRTPRHDLARLIQASLSHTRPSSP